MTDKQDKWRGLDVVVDTAVPAGYAELRDGDGNVVVSLRLDGRHLAVAPVTMNAAEYLEASGGWEDDDE